VILPPVVLIFLAGSGPDAGPATTAPLVVLKIDPWQGQKISPLATLSTMQPTWVQTALKARNSPLTGWPWGVQ